MKKKVDARVLELVSQPFILRAQRRVRRRALGGTNKGRELYVYDDGDDDEPDEAADERQVPRASHSSTDGALEQLYLEKLFKKPNVGTR